MKAIPCILLINTASGYVMSPIRCNSIGEAVKEGKNGYGFAYRVIVNGKVVRKGLCNN